MEIDAIQHSNKLVRLEDISYILFANAQKRDMCAAGRVKWSHCLSDAFGDSFRILIGENLGMSFSTALGCAAKVFEAIVSADPEIHFETRKNWIYYTESGHGLGYIVNLLTWFPELRALESSIKKATTFDLFDSQRKYRSSTSDIQSICACKDCKTSKSAWVSKSHKEYCLVVVMETILKVALILSNVSVDASLQPMRRGFDRLYKRQIKARECKDRTHEQMEERLGPIAWVVEPERSDEQINTMDHKMRLMMDGAMRLFTFINELEYSHGCAFSRNGVCAYREILNGTSIHDEFGFSPARIHIILGRIEWEGNAFDRVEDRYQDWNYDAEPNEWISPDDMNFGKPLLMLEESLGMLGITYCLTNTKKRSLYIVPTLTANNTLEAYGLVPPLLCQHSSQTTFGNQAIRGNTKTAEDQNVDVY